MNEREFIVKLLSKCTPIHNDVADLIQHYLRTNKFDDELMGNRFVKGVIPNHDIEVEYDTLTTELSYRFPHEFWEQCKNHHYSNK